MFMKIHVIGLAFLALFLFTGCDGSDVGASSEESQEVTARTFRVLAVVDGDTFKIRYDGDVTRVRFYAFNAPEPKDPGGPEATEALRKLIDGKHVRLVFPGSRKRDHYGRLLARVYADDVNIGASLSHGRVVSASESAGKRGL